ncbi:MAG: glycosyl hydrolase family 8 [Bacteroidales bacterium]|nr:glycosyl hydrolase family 8 [Bacteroidales bacterium]
MKKLPITLSLALISTMSFGQLKQPNTQGGFETGKYRNVFLEAGYKQKDIDKKVNEVFDEVFFSKDKHIYFEVNDTMAYISDIKNNDARTEGMSYGMMIAVQMNRKDIFDKLWRWAKTYMQHQDGPMAGYFAWSCKTDGTRNAEGPASDGELYFVTSLIFASNLWGDNTGINYKAEAQKILNLSESKPGGQVTPLIDRETRLITFVPTGFGSKYTDPSYHLPAFYEVWAKWADDGRSEYWQSCADSSRAFLHKCINSETGLNPDNCNFDGTLQKSPFPWGKSFMYDSWRVPMNIALDYSWACKDIEWQQNYANTIQNFFYKQGVKTFVDQYNVDGSTPERPMSAGGKTALRHSVGLIGTIGAISLASKNPHAIEFVKELWECENKPFEDGYFDAYYDGLLRLFAFMHLSGKYRVIPPSK